VPLSVSVGPEQALVDAVKNRRRELTQNQLDGPAQSLVRAAGGRGTRPSLA